MEPVLIYTDSSFVDVGAVRSFSMDMAFGSDEQDFEISFSEPVLSGGELLYIDGTEYGGIVDAVTQSTETDAIVYTGRTWHGMLAGKIIKPPTGSDYYTLSGDANACIRSLLAYVDLDGMLTGRATSSGITVNYQFNRFTNAYDGLLRMLSDAGAVLRIERHDGMTELWAEPRTLIEDEADSDIMDFAITDSVRVPNHLVCAGEGELQDRVIVDLYADADGNVSQTQTLTGVDEIAVFYNYSNADQEQLITDGTKELKSYQNGGGADLQVNSKGDWHVGDLLQVRDNRTGLVITSTIGKKIVKVSRGVLSVDYEIGDATAQSYGGGAQAETSLITPIANGGTGASTVEGALENLGIEDKYVNVSGDTMTGPLYGTTADFSGNVQANAFIAGHADGMVSEFLGGNSGQAYMWGQNDTTGNRVQMSISPADTAPYFRRYTNGAWSSWLRVHVNGDQYHGATSQSLSWVQAAKNISAPFYAPKASASGWCPTVQIDTPTASRWSIGNYNNENIVFAYVSKANMDASSNTSVYVSLRNTAGTIALQSEVNPTAFTITNSSYVTSDSYLKGFAIGNTRFMEFWVEANSYHNGSTWVTIGTVAAGYRPARQWRGNCTAGSSARPNSEYTGYLIVNTNGTVQVNFMSGWDKATTIAGELYWTA